MTLIWIVYISTAAALYVLFCYVHHVLKNGISFMLQGYAVEFCCICLYELLRMRFCIV